jgi:Cysteine protease
LNWVSCKKETSLNPSTKTSPQPFNNSRLSGVAPDDPMTLSKIKLIVSSDFVANSSRYLLSSQSLISGRKIKTTTSSDVTAPVTSITSPSNAASVSGTININVSATDNVGVSSVSLSVDGTVIATAKISPYTFSWNTTNVIDGTHTLTSTASDAAGNSSAYTITVTKNTTVIVQPPPAVPLPTTYQLITPVPRQQGSEGSCVSFSIAYGARSIEQYYKTGATSYSDATNQFSPEYVFNQVNLYGQCSSSATVPVLDLLKNQGVCTWQTMPYDWFGCSTQPNDVQRAEAANYKISSYSTIINQDQTAIKTMIASNHPIIVNSNIDQQFYNATPGFIWNSWTSNAGYHAFILCGYDDNMHAYKAMNSWGTNWGDGGFIWIDYDFFPTVASYYTYVMTL